ncbi:MAG: IS21 family transposase [Acidobacteria bacterium]|nr:MAG: IS21 family transposase [Acidobacteriota bacterium]
MLPAATQAEILRLSFAEHWSITRIAHHVGVNWKSVRKVLQRRSVALVRARPRARPTLLTPFTTQLQTLLAQDPERSAVNCLQHLRPAGYRGGITTLRGHLARIRPAPAREAFVALTFAPAERVQIDWAEFGDVFGIGRAVHAFLLVCCYSRLLTVEFTFSQTLEAFLRCHEHAFTFVGGYGREAQYDNLATAVAERRGRLVRWNPRFLAYAGHCGFKPVACTPGRGNEKGRVEDSVKYLRTNFWPGRTFRDLADLNAQAQAWRDTVANAREHRATRKVPSLLVAAERPHLLPLREPYDTDEVRSVVVTPTCRVAFDSNRYSVPWRLVEKTLTLRADAATVTVWYGAHRVARHARDWGRDHEVVCPAHAEGLLAHKPGARGQWQVQAVEQLGPHARQYLGLIRAGTRSLRAELEHLLLLTTLYGPRPVEAALGACLAQASVGSAHVAQWLQLQHPGPAAPPPLTLGDPRLTVPPVRPDLARYDALLLDPPEAAPRTEAGDGPADA